MKNSHGAGVFIFLVALMWGCQAAEKPLSPAQAAFKQDMRETIGKLSKVLIEPVSKADADSCEKAIASIYPEAPKDTQTFPFNVGVLNHQGILIYTIPPVKQIGDDYYQYKAVKDTLKGHRINNVRYFSTSRSWPVDEQERRSDTAAATPGRDAAASARPATSSTPAMLTPQWRP